MAKFETGKVKTGGRAPGKKNKEHSCLETIESAIEKVSYDRLVSEITDPLSIKTVNKIIAGFLHSANKTRVEFNDLHNLETK